MRKKQRPRPRNKAMGRYYLRVLFVAGIFLFLMWGCEGGSKSTHVTVVKRDRGDKPPPRMRVEEKVAVEKKEPKEPPYSYNPVGKRDPFKPFITLGPKKAVTKVPLTPLQRYDVSELKLVGILEGPTGYRALVEDAGGKGFIITKGTLIGRGDGRVKEIKKNRVIVEETYKDIFGQLKRRRITVPLRKPEEGGVR